jgi:uncharacterized membrane-anchored protein YjiN (DUF445 family)
MNNNFNISEWRRQQLQKEVVKEDTHKKLKNTLKEEITRILSEGEIKESKIEKIYDNIIDFLSPQYRDNMGKGAVVSAISRGLFLEENLNEGKITVKSIKFSDLGDKNLLPTNIGMGSSRKIKDEDDFKTWKADFLKKYGNIELEKGNAGWKVSSENEANKQAQADFDKYAKKK